MYSERAKALLLLYTAEVEKKDITFKQGKKIITDCDLALEIDPNNLDGLYHKAITDIYYNEKKDYKLYTMCTSKHCCPKIRSHYPPKWFMTPF